MSTSYCSGAAKWKSHQKVMIFDFDAKYFNQSSDIREREIEEQKGRYEKEKKDGVICISYFHLFCEFVATQIGR
jgi:hypothetical protein